MTEYVVTRWYRAPELLCDNQVYDAKVDVWSVGCIFAETLLRKPLLKGRDYMHQLGLIIDLVGPPGDAHTEFIINPDARAAIRAMRPSRSVSRSPRPPPQAQARDRMTRERPSSCVQAVPLKERFSGFSPTAVDFLSRMLVFDPNERADVKSLLRHPYLADIHHEEDEPECPRARCAGGWSPVPLADLTPLSQASSTLSSSAATPRRCPGTCCSTTCTTSCGTCGRRTGAPACSVRVRWRAGAHASDEAW